MNTVTHALLPVIVIACIRKKLPAFNSWQLATVALAGAAPDIINPHITLADRYTSWSHSLWFWALFVTSIFILHIPLKKRLPMHVCFAVSFAYLLHIVCDIISGGASIFYPWSNFTIGAYYYSAMLWIPTDFVCILTAYFIYRYPMLKGVKKADQSEQP